MRSRLVLASLLLTAFCAARPAAAQRAKNLAKANEVYVLIEGPKEAVLERREQDRWVGVCKAPCDRPFATGMTYRIAGEDVRDTDPFVLAGTTGTTVTLRVSEAKHDTGVALVQAGVIVTVLGGLTMVGGLFGSCSETGGSSACSSYSWLTYTGGAVAAVGVIGIVSGIVLMVQGARASVEAEPAAGIASRPSPDQSFSARFRIDASAPPPRAPLAPTTPILTFAF